jgi:hypothetical protein
VSRHATGVLESAFEPCSLACKHGRCKATSNTSQLVREARAASQAALHAALRCGKGAPGRQMLVNLRQRCLALRGTASNSLASSFNSRVTSHRLCAPAPPPPPAPAKQADTHPHTHTPTHPRTHPPTRTPTHTHTPTRKHARTHARTHSHMPYRICHTHRQALPLTHHKRCCTGWPPPTLTLNVKPDQA